MVQNIYINKGVIVKIDGAKTATNKSIAACRASRAMNATPATKP